MCAAPAAAAASHPFRRAFRRSSGLAGRRCRRRAAGIPAVLRRPAKTRSRRAGGARRRRRHRHDDWRAPCAAAAALVEPLRRLRRGASSSKEFSPWLAGNNGKTSGLFTGYFEPELRGSRRPGGAFATPLLRRPPDLVAADLGLFRPDWRGEHIAGRVVDGRLRPYQTRAEIERGALDRLKLGFLWVDDPVDAFVLSIQGSGRVRLGDGTLVNVGYDGQNGRPYVAIGRLLVERGEMTRDEVSLAAIRAWLAAHPDQAQALMDENPSYVFFREVKGDAPVGAEGAVLTAGRSRSPVDTLFIPVGRAALARCGAGMTPRQDGL